MRLDGSDELAPYRKASLLVYEHFFNNANLLLDEESTSTPLPSDARSVLNENHRQFFDPPSFAFLKFPKNRNHDIAPAKNVR